MAINVKDKLVTLESLGVAYSAEQDAREEADQALSTRIDNIVAPEGDPSLTEVSDARVSGSTTHNTLKARLDADQAAVGTEIAGIKADLGDKVSSVNGLSPDVNGNVEIEVISPETASEAVSDWLDEHPEATTTVQDGAVTKAKFSLDAKQWIRGKKVFNVTDYGAVGDGVTDDADSIRSAISALPASNWILHFPPGVYLQGDGQNTKPCHFKLFSNMSDFEIDGYGATILANPSNACTNDNGGFEFSECSNGVIRGLTYNGNIATRAPSMGDGDLVNKQSAFRVLGCDHLSFIDCTSLGACMDGWSISRKAGQNPTYADTSKYISLIRCVAKYSYRQGASIGQSHYGLIDGCEFSHTATIYGTLPKDGIDFEAGNPFDGGGQSNWIVKNSRFIDNAGDDIEMLGKTFNCRIEGCYFEGKGVKVQTNYVGSTRNNDIVGNIFNNANATVNVGTLVADNKFYNGGVTISADSYDWYAQGKCRVNGIYRNYFEYSFNISEETYNSSNVISTARRPFTIENYATEVCDNIVVNATGSIFYTTGGLEILKFNGNVFKSNIVPAEGKYLGTTVVYVVNAKEKKKNQLESEYYVDGSNSNGLVTAPDHFTHQIFVANTGSKPYILVYLPVSFRRMTVKTSREELEAEWYFSSQIAIRRKNQGSVGTRYLTLSMSKQVSFNDEFVTVISGVESGHSVWIDVITASTMSHAQRDSIRVENVATLPDGLTATLLKPHPVGMRITALPDASAWSFNDGDYLLYDTRPIYWYKNNWYYADGTQAS